MPQISVAGRALEYQWIEGRDPALVFLHEGLGSIRQWRDFPERVAQVTGCRVLLYDRYGYGRSEVLREARVTTDFMHREALTFLPAILAELNIRNPVLVGHSDGGSIALIHASGRPVRGVVTMAAHVFVEEICVTSISKANAGFETSGLKQALGKYHTDPAKTFHLWADAWLDPAFRDWNIESFLPGIRCPVLAIQGEQDEYGTMAQLEAIRRQVSGPCQLLKLPGCGHAPHKDKPEEALRAVRDFVSGLDEKN
jgi:pimeloyl-ACP methyl ester carboxylesterase